MAIVKVNYDRFGKDLLDNFVPFVADRIYHADQDAVSTPEIREAVRQEYGIAVPLAALGTLIKRCARNGLLRQETGIYIREKDRLAEYDLTPARRTVERQHQALIQLGIEFAAQQYEISPTEADFEAAVQSFIRQNSAPLLATVIDGQPIANLVEEKDGPLKYVVPAFVANLESSDTEGFSYFTEVVKGSLLASALYFPDVSAVNRKFDRLSIYFDTTLLLRAVGACGPEREEAAVEMLSLALRLGGQLRCFEHTLNEMQGVLEACKSVVKSGNAKYFGEATEFMVADGWGVSDVITLSDNLETRLRALGVKITEKPEHVERLTLDEERLEKILMDEVRYKSTPALRRDVDSVSSIYRLRRGNEFMQIERSRGIFVTSNSALVRAARKYGKIEQFDRGTVPLVIPDHSLVTLMWLKEPLASPDLPASQIIADCHAAMQPKDDVWLLVVEKIEKMARTGDVSEDEYTILRQSIHVRSVIMVEIGEDPEAFTEGTKDRVLARAQRNIAQQAIDDAAIQRQHRSVLSSELAELKEQEAARARRLDERAQNYARTILNSVLALLAPLAIFGAILTAPFPSERTVGVGGLLGFVISCIVGIAILLSAYALVFGGSLREYLRRFEKHLSRRIRNMLG
ncbi:hypothetical protein [Actinoplanes sp. NPDC048796]|uniref:hypothetical protein n=1 Tax=Actinoplanes sp. NPDC048796 TaxID=3155640 RepID=UPI0033D14EFF